jgi:hypothetical protein
LHHVKGNSLNISVSAIVHAAKRRKVKELRSTAQTEGTDTEREAGGCYQMGERVRRPTKGDKAVRGVEKKRDDGNN